MQTEKSCPLSKVGELPRVGSKRSVLWLLSDLFGCELKFYWVRHFSSPKFLFLFCFLKSGYYCVSVGLEFTLQTRLTLNSQRSTWPVPLSAGIKVMHYNGWLLCLPGSVAQFQVLLLNSSNENSILLEQKQTSRSIELKRGPRHVTSQLKSSEFLTQMPKNTHWKKDIHLNKLFWGKWVSACTRTKLYPYLAHCTEINSKYSKSFSIGSEILKPLQEKVRVHSTHRHK